MNKELLLRASVLELLLHTPAKPVVEWFLAEDWRTWVSHYLIVGIVSLATGWWTIWVAFGVTFVYLFREGMDASKNRARWVDHSMDWVSAWGGFGTAFLVLNGDWIGTGVITLFALVLGIIAYAAGPDAT